MRNIKNNKAKIKRAVLLITIVSFFTLFLLIFFSGKTSSHVENKFKAVRVSYGETLWEIARIELINNEYYNKQDIRYIIKEIKQINKLESSDLYPGQELIIPSL